MFLEVTGSWALFGQQAPETFGFVLRSLNSG